MTSTYKLTILGNISVGKTSLIQRYITNSFYDNYSQTIALDFYSKSLSFRNVEFTVSIWDTAGQEKYKSLIPNYIKNSSLIYIVYDISNRDSFDSIPNWIEFISSSSFFFTTEGDKLSTIPNMKSKVYLVGNKSDIRDEDRRVSYDEGIEFGKNLNLTFLEVSAKTGFGIDFLFYSSFLEFNCFEYMFDEEVLYNKIGLVDEFIKNNKIDKIGGYKNVKSNREESSHVQISNKKEENIIENEENKNKGIIRITEANIIRNTKAKRKYFQRCCNGKK